MSSMSSQMPVSQATSFYIPGPRKRSLSVDKSHAISCGMASNKSLKIVNGQSPIMGKRAQGYTMKKPQMNIKVLAATIIYVAMEPFDHWPVPLVEVYAEDCFGPRIWVDNPACRPLVRNLSFIHSDDVKGRETHMHNNFVKLEMDALKISEFYQKKGKPKTKQKIPQIISSASYATGTSTEKISRLSESEKSKAVLGFFPTSKTNKSTQVKTMVTSCCSKNDEDTSDSGDEEEVAITSIPRKPFDEDDESSSSSGEDEEMNVLNKRYFGVTQRDVAASSMQTGDDESTSLSEPLTSTIKLMYPIQQESLSFSRARQRYFGQNLEFSYLAVSEKLSQRLDIKSKQNSGLLHCLPHFTSIPHVRTIITANLEKWLQSPALSGLAKNLFSKTVKSMKNVDPPLPADLEALDNILCMRLKTNQLNTHIENVTAVATKIPTLAIAKHIYGKILRKLLVMIDSHSSAFSDNLSMICAVHHVSPSQLRANGIASSILDILTNPPPSLHEVSKPQLVQRIQKLITFIAKKFGSSFDVCAILNAMLQWKVTHGSLWTIRHEENKARIMFQCVILLVDHTVLSHQSEPIGKLVKMNNPSESNISTIRTKLMQARKILIRWCCTDYVPLCPLISTKDRNNCLIGSSREEKDEIIGAIPTNYNSILDGMSERNFPSWVNVIRCMLFLENSESPLLRQFLLMGDTTIEDPLGWDIAAKRINFCCDYGADVDDEIIHVVLKTVTEEENDMPNDIALLLLEHMFESCKTSMKPSLLIQDSKLLLKLYNLVEYIPHDKADILSIPRLAYPGMWWRVTGLALIMCGVSPVVVGAVALKNFPTLKALIKMITSDRYRFPTVDCDDEAREEEKKNEQKMREKEAKIIEYLFDSFKTEGVGSSRKKIDNRNQVLGSRTSRRQREKSENEMKYRRLKEENEAYVKENHRNKLLRMAEKSIMILDPNAGPRKPPVESARLIFSIQQLFDLSRIFQRNTKPDFLLATIGSTTRGAIERAHDWLIPIISFLPQAISRLPASASCFLLLRAYGTYGGDKSQLQELSEPLLQHVRNSLLGKFGEADAVRAFDLLLTDIASYDPDRRRCARRVLTNAIGKAYLKRMDETFSGSNHAWAINLMHVEHAKSILGNAAKRLAVAASFERSGNLRFLVLAIHKISNFSAACDTLRERNFAPLLIELISKRPRIFATALGLHADFRSLAIQEVVEEFKLYVEKKNLVITIENSPVKINLCYNSYLGKDKTATQVQMPLALLQSLCVLLGIWSDEENKKDRSYIAFLVAMLMKSRDSGNSNNDLLDETNGVEGLASAKLLKTQESAILVESWVMLVKSKSDYIAKKAALAAPSKFLSRLLLCSGLPRESVLILIDRLGRLGDNAVDADKTFNQLLAPFASCKWDIGRLGHRQDVARKLFGRISAYSRMHGLVQADVEGIISFSFVEWLSRNWKSSQRSTKLKVKKAKIAPDAQFCCNYNESISLCIIPTRTPESDIILSSTQMVNDATNMTKFLGFKNFKVAFPKKSNGYVKALKHFLVQIFEEDKPNELENWLRQNYILQSLRAKGIQGLGVEDATRCIDDDISFLLLKCYTQTERKLEGIAFKLVKWIPILSSSHGSPKFWRILFAYDQKPAFLWDNLVSRCFQIWNQSHVTFCRRWILSDGVNANLDLVKVVRFLIQGSTFTAVHIVSFEENPIAVESLVWGRTEEFVRSATDIALDCLLSKNYENRLRSRNNLPECLTLLLLIGRLGCTQAQFLSRTIWKRIQNNNVDANCMLLLSLLRIYVYFPVSMNLGTALLRSNLMVAVEIGAGDWLSWRSPLDDFVQIMLDIAFSDIFSQRLIQTLIEISKKHPLSLLRKLNQIENILDKDASGGVLKVKACKKGLINGRNLNGSLPANVYGGKMKITVTHWGYDYDNYFWSIMLDLILAVPNDVLFQCGLEIGMLKLLGVYSRLVLVHSQLCQSIDIDRVASLKEKLCEILGIFKSVNLEGFDSWMFSSNYCTPTLGSMSNILVGCGILSRHQTTNRVEKA